MYCIFITESTSVALTVKVLVTFEAGDDLKLGNMTGVMELAEAVMPRTHM
jgi:hypothetical protein